MSFKDDIQTIKAMTEAKLEKVFTMAAMNVWVSITLGLSITGAPGQLVDTGFLRDSWQNILTGPWMREIVTNCIYALEMEEGYRWPYGRLTQRSEVGGFHSVALTRAGWKNIVADAVRFVNG